VETSPAFLVGANVTIQEAVKAFKVQSATAGYAYLLEIANYWANIANAPVRNVILYYGQISVNFKSIIWFSDWHSGWKPSDEKTPQRLCF
jgi:hypothetical protein